MEVRTIYTAQVPDDDTNLVMFNFNEKNPVSREVLAYTLLSLVAEVSLVGQCIKAPQSKWSFLDVQINGVWTFIWTLVQLDGPN